MTKLHYVAKAVYIFVAAVISTVFIAYGCRALRRVPVLRDKQLMDVQDEHQTARLLCPQSFRQTLLIVLPVGWTNKNALSGFITISDGQTSRTDLAVTMETLVSCNWLESRGLSAYIIENPKAKDRSDLSMKAGRVYDINVDGLPIGSSIWLRSLRPSGWDFGFRPD